MSSSCSRGSHLPALVGRPVVGVVLGDVIVDAVQSELFVLSQSDGLDDQLCIGVRRFGVILEKKKKHSMRLVFRA